MAVIGQKFLFIQRPRTGCTAVAEGVLVPQLGGKQIGRKHAKLKELLELGQLTPEVSQGLFKFTTVRSPFDSEVSLYVKMRSSDGPPPDIQGRWGHHSDLFVSSIKVAHEATFTDWLVYRYTRGHIGSFFVPRALRSENQDTSHSVGMDFVMRFESLQADFDTVLKRLGFGPIEIPHIHPTSNRPRDYREYYTPLARKIVERTYRSRIKEYGYTF